MSLAAAYTISASTPAIMRNAEWRNIPGAVRQAFWRAIGDKEVGGGAGERERAMESEWVGTVTRAELLAAVPQAAPLPVPGPDNPTVRTWGDLYRVMSDEQINVFLAVLADSAANARQQAEARLTAGTYAETRADMLRFIAFYCAHIRRGFRPAGVLVRTTTLAPLSQPRELGALNQALAGRWAQSMIAPGEAYEARAELIRDTALNAPGVRPDASLEQLAIVAGFIVANTFTAQGIAMDEAIERARALPVALDNQQERVAAINAMVGSALDIGPEMAYPSGSAGIGDSFKKLMRHPLKWFRSVLEETGKGVQQFAANILDAEKNIPWLSTFLLKPLTFHLWASVINQVGAVLVEGTTAAFDAKDVAGDAASSFQIIGTIHLAVAPFLPVPYSVAAAAIGAALVAGGIAINRALHDAEAAKAVSASKKAAEAAAAQADQELAALRAQAAAENAAAEAVQERVLGPQTTTEPTGQKRSTGPPRWFVPVAAGVVGVAALILLNGGKT